MRLEPSESDKEEAKKEGKIYCSKIDVCPFSLCCHFCSHYHIDCANYCFKEYWNICPYRCNKEQITWRKIFHTGDEDEENQRGYIL